MAEPADAPGSDNGVYYAPVDESSDAASAASASAQAQAGGSVLSRAQILPFAWGRSGQGLGSVELYLDGSYLGRTP
ncbi:MAG TPA: hypothetical protein VNZ67_12850, partial [bacterium]|nr:hypothetical protein [bacterium]